MTNACSLGPSVLAGLVGSGIQASRTPRMHELEGAALGLRYVYRLIDLEALRLDIAALPDILSAAQEFGFAGLNVTYPCKQAILPFLDRCSEDAAALRAVNTVVFEGGARVGHNTDWWGFAESFRRELPDVPRERVLQLGAGGAGAAVAHALLSLGVSEVMLFDVDEARAQSLAKALCTRFGSGRAAPAREPERASASADGLVNATPVGMLNFPGTPVSQRVLRRELWVADIVYFPIETELLQAARALGCRTMSGEGMAVFQAVEAFRLFTRCEPNIERMFRHFHSS